MADPLGNAAPAEAPDPITRVIDAAIAHLKDRLPPKVMVEHFPDRPADYDFPSYDAAALVLYDGSRFDAGGLRGEQGLHEQLRIAVALLVRSLNGNAGAYRLIHDIRTALHGQVCGGATGFRPVEVDTEREQDGVWQYRIVFEAQIIAAPRLRAQGVSLPRSFQSERP